MSELKGKVILTYNNDLDISSILLWLKEKEYQVIAYVGRIFYDIREVFITSYVIAHGATGKWNNQIRFELNCYNLYLKITLHEEKLNFNGISIFATAKELWNTDAKLVHIRRITRALSRRFLEYDFVLECIQHSQRYLNDTVTMAIARSSEDFVVQLHSRLDECTGRLSMNATEFIRTQALKLKEFYRFNKQHNV
ncbi:ASSY synthase, partial [Acromyrmex charruanus]